MSDPGAEATMYARRSTFAYGNGFRITVSTTSNIAAFAPIARPNVPTATAVNPGDRLSERTAWRRSVIHSFPVHSIA